MHDLPLISTLAGGLAAALVFGWITQRLGLSTLVGYMLAGILVGPYTPGFVADANLATQMAEIGVILLMFSVGMHFHPQELLRVWRIAVPGAVVRMAGSYGLEDEGLDFRGTLRLQASLSQTVGGVKSVFLKLIDPFFRKNGAGAELPIKVDGVRDKPKFGLDTRKLLPGE